MTNAAGNLVDLNGNEIDGAYLTDYPGFPGFDSINASQTLAYVADMLECGVPVVNGYISDLHGNEFIPALSGPGEPCYQAPDALGSGSACYIAQAQYYNQAFGTFFQRLAADGITPKNTLFVLSSDEGDHEAGANVGRAIQPTPANCDGATVSGDTVTPDVPCTYPAGSFGELDGNITGLLATEKTRHHPVQHGGRHRAGVLPHREPRAGHRSGPAPSSTPWPGSPRATRTPGTTQPITNYLADPTEEAILHMVNADPARTPTLAMFAKPDYYLYDGGTTCSGLVRRSRTTGYAWDHGDYAAEINTNYVGFVGPGVRHLGLDGTSRTRARARQARTAARSRSRSEHLAGPWTDETDIRPTLLYLTGLRDDYEHDGRVITQVLADPNHALAAPGVTALGECYKQLNSSVGEFGAYTLAGRHQRDREHQLGRFDLTCAPIWRYGGSRSPGTGWPCRSRASSRRRHSETCRLTVRRRRSLRAG